MRVLRLFWWQRAPRFGNFGDELSRLLVERLSGCAVVWSPPARADLIAIGSLLEPHLVSPTDWASFRGVVWGAGRMFANAPVDLRGKTVLAVRGPETLSRLILDQPGAVDLGDPGLLVTELTDRPVPTCALGILPHWSERYHPFYRSRLTQQADVTVIDPCAPPEQVLAQIVRCRYLLASAMHGLIVSAALGIGHGWLRLNTGQEASAGYPEFKYRDHYAALQQAAPPGLFLKGDEDLEQVLSAIASERLPDVSPLQERLRACFPYLRNAAH